MAIGTSVATRVQALPTYYMVQTDPFYTSSGIDVYIDEFKSLNANLGYILFYEYDFHLGGVEEKVSI